MLHHTTKANDVLLQKLILKKGKKQNKTVFMLFTGGKHVSAAPAGPAHCQGAL